MNQKPLFIPLMAISLILIAISFPIQIAILFDYSFLDFAQIFSKLTPLNYVVIMLLVYTSYLTYKMKPSVFIALPILNLFVFLNNFIVAEYGQIYGHFQTFFVSSIFLAFSLSYYRKDIYRVYHDLKFRYWLTSPRFKKNLPVDIIFNNHTIHAETFDISKTGLFIKVDPNKELFDINTHQDIDIIIYDKKRKIKLSAYIMRKCMAQGKYPAGIGIKLNHSDESVFWDKEFKKITKWAYLK